ncbi:MAG: hypothetical protein ACYTGX_12320 [Planctomycetota bacterium]|jgi:hypothetical protein
MRVAGIAWTGIVLAAALAGPAAAQDGGDQPAEPAPKAGQDPQPAPKPAPETKPEAAKPEAAEPGAQDPPAAAQPAPADPPTARRRRRPRLTPRLPKRTTTLEFSVGAVFSFFDGSSRKDTLNSIGNRIEFDEISLDDMSLVVPVELQVHLTNRFTLLTDFFVHSASGGEVTTTAYTFDGVLFPKGSMLDAELDVISGSFAARYFATSNPWGTFEIEAGLRYLGVKLEYSAGATESIETTDAFIPFVGFHGTLNFTEWQKEQLGLEGGGRVGLLAIGDSADNQTNAYLHAYVRFALPLPFLSSGRFRAKVTLGYEYWFMDAEREDSNQDEDFELLYHGPAFGIVLSF